MKCNCGLVTEFKLQEFSIGQSLFMLFGTTHFDTRSNFPLVVLVTCLIIKIRSFVSLFIFIHYFGHTDECGIKCVNENEN
jgi:hypothetical protein